MVRYGVLAKRNFGEIPPRVEYRLTKFGEKLIAILDQVEALQKDVDRKTGSAGAEPAACLRQNVGPAR